MLRFTVHDQLLKVLPKDRAEGYRPFQVVEVDFVGPITYKIKEKKKDKV